LATGLLGDCEVEGAEETRLRLLGAPQEGLTGSALRAFLWADARNDLSICFLVWALQQGLMYLEQLRNIEKKVAFDPTVLIDLEDYDAMCA
jgi:hypothetical protein